MRWVVLALCLAVTSARAESELVVPDYAQRSGFEAAIDKRLDAARTRKKKDAVELGEELKKTIASINEKDWPARKQGLAKLAKQFADATATTVQLVSLSSKKIEIYVNGKALRPNQSTTCDGKIELRAVIVDSRRDLARKFVKGTASKEVVAAGEYALVLRNGNDKTQDWRVTSEKYEWKPGGKTHSTSVAKDDVLEIEDSVKGSVTAAIEWTGPSVDSDTETATYEIKIK